jgi:FAD/FMN-containing dehydrogenase
MVKEPTGYTGSMDVRPPLNELERVIDGDLVAGGELRTSRAPKPFNARFDEAIPQAVVRCTSAGDVAETIAFIRRHRLSSAARSGGHCLAGRSTTTGILIDVSPMRTVSVVDGRLTIDAGAVLGEVYAEAIRHGVTIAGGSCPSVGIAGLTLGGGLGILGRTYGVTSDSLVGARIVLADGRVIDCDEHHDADLFWALRGAGTGHFGVVTSLVFRPIPAPTVATTFHLEWPFADAVSVAEAWMVWSPSAPEALAASMVVSASAEREEAPTVEVFGTMLGAVSEARHQLEDLTSRLGSDPSSTFVEEMGYEDTMRYWAARAGERLEEPRATPMTRSIHAIKSEYFARPLPTEAIAALLGGLSADRSGGQARELDFSPWGGAYNRIEAEATAFAHRDAAFWVKHGAVVPTDATANQQMAARDWVGASWAFLHPWGTGGVFPNFADADLEDWQHAYYGSNYERLVELKARYDPDNLFRFPQSLPVS